MSRTWAVIRPGAFEKNKTDKNNELPEEGVSLLWRTVGALI